MYKIRRIRLFEINGNMLRLKAEPPNYLNIIKTDDRYNYKITNIIIVHTNITKILTS